MITLRDLSFEEMNKFFINSDDTHAPTPCVYFRIFIRFYFDFPIHYCFISQIFAYPFAFGRHSHSHHATCSPHVQISSRTCPERSRGTSAPQSAIHVRTVRFGSENSPNQSEYRTAHSPDAETSWTRYQHNDEAFYYISEVDLQKYYYIWIGSFAIGSFFILKFRLTL